MEKICRAEHRLASLETGMNKLSVPIAVLVLPPQAYQDGTHMILPQGQYI